MRDDWIREGDAFLLVYAINDASSFQQVIDIRTEILNAKEDELSFVQEGSKRNLKTKPVAVDIPIVLCGNKCDLKYKRVIPKEKGEELAEEWGCPFFETSAKTKTNNIVAYHETVREIMRQKQRAEALNEMEAEPGCSCAGAKCCIL